MLQILDRHHGQVNGMFTGDECLAGKNPVQCTINPDHMWTTNGPESNIFGLEPNYGCCTSNMHQAWPKLAANLWMRSSDAGFAAVAYAPSEVHFHSGSVPVSLVLDTDYPFRDSLDLTVTVDGATRFPLLLRVPEWAVEPSVETEGGGIEGMDPGTFHRVEREWRGTTRITLRFPMRPKVTIRYNGSGSLERGPLVYAHSPEEEWTRVNVGKPHRELPHGDFEVRPASPWNYGALLDEARVEGVRFTERPVGERPFSPEGAGMEATILARRLSGWGMNHGWAGEFAPGPHDSEEPLEELTLIPYGCTNIRVTEFPRIRG
jgi:hypothetical protein